MPLGDSQYPSRMERLDGEPNETVTITESVSCSETSSSFANDCSTSSNFSAAFGLQLLSNSIALGTETPSAVAVSAHVSGVLQPTAEASPSTKRPVSQPSRPAM